MPWELVGSLPLEESRHIWLGISRWQETAPHSRNPGALQHHFLPLNLACSSQNPFLGLRTWGSGRDGTEGHKQTGAGSSLTWSGPWSPGLCRNQRTAAWGDLGRHSRKVLLCSVPKTVVVATGPAAFSEGKRWLVSGAVHEPPPVLQGPQGPSVPKPVSLSKDPHPRTVTEPLRWGN